jgi:5-methylthioadenosine/S-adenosylhomocysteine deaminase
LWGDVSCLDCLFAGCEDGVFVCGGVEEVFDAAGRGFGVGEDDDGAVLLGAQCPGFDSLLARLSFGVAVDEGGDGALLLRKYYMDGGLLGPTMFFGHFVHTDDFILQETAKAGAGMSWQPLSNGRLAAGLADIPKYLKMGIRVGMGVDGEASADLADPFENMRTGLYAIRMKYEDAGIMSPYQVMWLHTMGSADVMGVKHKVGSLEPGKYADFLLINPARLGPVLEDPYANLVFVTGERDIDSVYVGGELLVEHNKFLHQDFSKVQAESAQRVMAIK